LNPECPAKTGKERKQRAKASLSDANNEAA